VQTVGTIAASGTVALSWAVRPEQLQLVAQACFDFLPLSAEIEFWRVRNAAFSSLYEQLNLPSVKKFLAVLEGGSADQNLLTSFKAQFNELKKVWHLLWKLQSLSCVLQSVFADLQTVAEQQPQQASAVWCGAAPWAA